MREPQQEAESILHVLRRYSDAPPSPTNYSLEDKREADNARGLSALRSSRTKSPSQVEKAISLLSSCLKQVIVAMSM